MAHIEIKEKIERGNGIASLIKMEKVFEALMKSGFKILIKEDLASYKSKLRRGNEIPWSTNFSPKISLSNFQHTRLARYLINKAIGWIEALKLAPPGMAKMHSALSEGADALRHADESGIFTPMLFVLAQKPM